MYPSTGKKRMEGRVATDLRGVMGCRGWVSRILEADRRGDSRPSNHHSPTNCTGSGGAGRQSSEIELIGVPRGIRTPVTAVKGRCPGPLDDGDAAGRIPIYHAPQNAPQNEPKHRPHTRPFTPPHPQLTPAKPPPTSPTR